MLARAVFSASIAAAILSAGTATPATAAAVEIVRAIGGLPAHVVARFHEAVAFVELSSGESLVLDRRAHTVYLVNAAKTTVRELLKAGYEQGTILEPGALVLGPKDIFAVSDAPKGYERIKYFGPTGLEVGGFFLETRALPRLVIGTVVLSGAGAMIFTARSFVVNQPETGSLFTEIDLDGRVMRRFGALRPTGQEGDRDVHYALNVGVPLVHANGDFTLVFRSGVPAFRRYTAAGDLLYERHIEGPELDREIQSLPTTWMARRPDEGRLPIVPPLVRAAGLDRTGRLWVSLTEPFTYVYDTHGNKIRTVQFTAAGVTTPNAMFFTARHTLLVTPGCYEFPVDPPPSK